ncbi:MAG TPA: MarR family transcriptional regulator [Acidobacteriaceae bacterium]|jgi:MarR family 2-MHQ and catechol resistance regulon transcriptional repressor|nr:MarR family transcriptional regulator [Acidobacteriaceae bacterium]
MSKRSKVTPPHLWIVLSKCHHALRLNAECSIKGTGLVLSDFMVLEALLHKGPMTITEIQKKALLASGSMTAAVDRVERKGLLVRRATKEDRRARVLELTDAGAQLIQAAFAQHAADLDQIMSALSPSEQEQLYRLARKLGKAAEETTLERPTQH